MLYDDHENYHQYQLVCHWLQCTGKLPSCLVGLVGQVASSVQMEISNNLIFVAFENSWFIRFIQVDLVASKILCWWMVSSFISRYRWQKFPIFVKAVVTQGSSSQLRCVFKVYRIVPLASIIPLPVGTRVHLGMKHWADNLLLMLGNG